MATIGFIGLGHMGTPMVRNVLKHHHQVKVFDVVADAVAASAKDGAIACQSVAETVTDVDIAFIMVQTGEQVSAICHGAEGIFANADKATLLIDSSSIDVKTSRQLHREARKKGFAMLDAPVSGGVAGAGAATLTFMVGGAAKDFQRAEPILHAMGQTIVHAGAEGNGQAAKICNNMLLGVSMIAVSEAFTMAENLGLDPKKLFEISSHASGQCWAMTSYCPVPDILPDVPSNNDYQPGFTAKMMLKDLRLSQTASKNSQTATPLGAAATSLYAMFVANGYAELDFSAIIKMLAGKLH